MRNRPVRKVTWLPGSITAAPSALSHLFAAELTRHREDRAEFA
jgi:hypothetical protein